MADAISAAGHQDVRTALHQAPAEDLAHTAVSADDHVGLRHERLSISPPDGRGESPAFSRPWLDASDRGGDSTGP
jgi:hypothetical protein